MIRNIVFDMGKVLVVFDPDRYITRFVPDPADYELIRRELFRSVEWARLDRGVMTSKEVAASVSARLPERLHGPVARIMAEWHQDIPPMEGMYELVKELKEAGCPLYLLSNTSEEFHEFRKQVPALGLFDRVFISADWHLLKPDPAIYRVFLAHFGLRPEECVFIDDATLNVEAAMNAGMDGIVFHGDPADLRRKLHGMGIEVEEI